MERESNTGNPEVNLCPTCGYPMKEHAVCSNPDCDAIVYCDHCGKRLNVYGVCTGKLCLRARCCICDVHLDVYGICPNETCPNSMKSPPDVRLSPDDDDFQSATVPPEVPETVICNVCGTEFRLELDGCPRCPGEGVDQTDEPFDEDPTDPDAKVYHSDTIIPDEPVSVTEAGIDRSGVHSNPRGFAEEAHSEVRTIDSSAPTVAPPPDDGAPELELGVEEIFDPEEADLINSERERLQDEESA